MKRSEAVNIVADLLEAYSGPAKLRAERLLNELSPNLAFDPEEEPLPERLEFQEYGDEWYIAENSPSQQRFVGGSESGRLLLSHNLSPCEKKARALEAVRRWNAWPELKRLIADWKPGTTTSIATARKLKAILDGREGE